MGKEKGKIEKGCCLLCLLLLLLLIFPHYLIKKKNQPCSNGSLQLLGNLHLLWQVLIIVRLKSSSTSVTSVSVLVGGSTVRSQIIRDYVFRGDENSNPIITFSKVVYVCYITAGGILHCLNDEYLQSV